MRTMPAIIIPCYRVYSDHFEEDINALPCGYTTAVTRAGGLPLMVAVGQGEDALRVAYEMADGILLAGGGDVAAHFYGGPDSDKVTKINAARDEDEIALVNWAVGDKKPILGICRGEQVMNVALGGDLVQDIPDEVGTELSHDTRLQSDNGRHEVAIEPGSMLRRILEAEKIHTNSFHHQAARRVPPRCRVVARTPDGVVEGLEVPGHPFAIGVQWHPEDMVEEHESARRLFAAFVEASGKNGTRRGHA